MQIRLVESDADIAVCFPAMKQLRTHLAEDEFVARVHRQGRQGYRLAVAGF